MTNRVDQGESMRKIKNPMDVLVACECSGIVRDAFIAKGHNAVSCDLKETQRPGPHIRGGGDVREVLGRRWDMARGKAAREKYAATLILMRETHDFEVAL
jgi:hypothetical protein